MAVIFAQNITLSITNEEREGICTTAEFVPLYANSYFLTR